MSSQRDPQWAHNEFTSVMITAQYTLHLLVGFWKYVHFMLSKLIFKQAEIIALDNWKKKKQNSQRIKRQVETLVTFWSVAKGRDLLRKGICFPAGEMLP